MFEAILKRGLLLTITVLVVCVLGMIAVRETRPFSLDTSLHRSLRDTLIDSRRSKVRMSFQRSSNICFEPLRM